MARQVPLSMGFPRQGYWSGLPFPSPVDLPNPGVEPASPALAGGFFTTETIGKPIKDVLIVFFFFFFFFFVKDFSRNIPTTRNLPSVLLETRSSLVRSEP